MRSKRNVLKWDRVHDVFEVRRLRMFLPESAELFWVYLQRHIHRVLCEFIHHHLVCLGVFEQSCRISRLCSNLGSMVHGDEYLGSLTAHIYTYQRFCQSYSEQGFPIAGDMIVSPLLWAIWVLHMYSIISDKVSLYKWGSTVWWEWFVDKVSISQVIVDRDNWVSGRVLLLSSICLKIWILRHEGLQPVLQRSIRPFEYGASSQRWLGNPV